MRPVLDTNVLLSGLMLVTGDSDLLALRENYPIVTPAEFASRFD
jgi:predicted nucleic acid-binding protein